MESINHETHLVQIVTLDAITLMDKLGLDAPNKSSAVTVTALVDIVNNTPVVRFTFDVNVTK